MKRSTTLTGLTLALFVLFSFNALAVDPVPGTNTTVPLFIDEDGDGICDNFTNGSRVLGLGKGRGNGTRANFVDADGDGVCDNFVAGGRGMGRGMGRGNGTRANFVDADGDGVCDNFVAGRGMGRGRGNRIALSK